MRLLVASSRTKRALEIGGASGYSAIWLGLGLRTTGGTLVTIEYDPQRAREAKANIHRAGMDDVVTVVLGRRVQGDPEAAGHVRLRVPRRVEARLPEVLRPGVPAARPRRRCSSPTTSINKQTEMARFLDTIQKNPALFTSIVSPGSEGMSVSWNEASDEAGPHHRRAAGSRRRPARRRHGPVGVPHRRAWRAARGARATRSSTKATCGADSRDAASHGDERKKYIRDIARVCAAPLPDRARQSLDAARLPLVLGGDHSLAAGIGRGERRVGARREGCRSA